MILLSIIALTPIQNTKFCMAYRDSIPQIMPRIIREYGQMKIQLMGAFKGEGIATISYHVDSLMTMEGYIFGVGIGHTRIYVHPLEFSRLILPNRKYVKVFSNYGIAYAHTPTTFCIFQARIE